MAANLAHFQANYPGVVNVLGGWSGQLSNNGERIRLVDKPGDTVDSVTYADEGDWAVRAAARWITVTRAGCGSMTTTAAASRSN